MEESGTRSDMNDSDETTNLLQTESEDKDEDEDMVPVDEDEESESAKEDESVTDFNGKSYKDLTICDLSHVSFESVAHVDRFYLLYSVAKGFSMRKHKFEKSRASDQVIKR